MKAFDNYEIHGVHEFSDDGRTFCEQVPDDQATFWTLYGHIDGEGVEAIGDFATRQHVEETFQRITGTPFAGASEVVARVRVMHAGPKLLEALRKAEVLIAANIIRDDAGCLSIVRAAIAEATGRAA